MSFSVELTEAGFSLIQERRGIQRFAKRTDPYLAWWVQTNADGTATLSWEHELGQFVRDHSMQTSVQDELSLLLYPAGDVQGSAEVSWILEEVERVEAALRSLNLLGG